MRVTCNQVPLELIEHGGAGQVFGDRVEVTEDHLAARTHRDGIQLSQIECSAIAIGVTATAHGNHIVINETFIRQEVSPVPSGIVGIATIGVSIGNEVGNVAAFAGSSVQPSCTCCV